MVVGTLTFANRLPFVHVYFYFDVRRSHTCTNDKPLTKFSFSFVFFLFLFEAAHIPTHSNTICVCCNNAQQIRLEFVSVLFVSAVFDSIQFISHFVEFHRYSEIESTATEAFYRQNAHTQEFQIAHRYAHICSVLGGLFNQIQTYFSFKIGNQRVKNKNQFRAVNSTRFNHFPHSKFGSQRVKNKNQFRAANSKED